MERLSTLIILILLVSSSLFSQTEIKLHLNSRNAKDTCLFDYYSKIEAKTLIDSCVEIRGMVNYERDNGNPYYSYMAAINTRYGGVEYFMDTEKRIDYFSASFTYPFTKWFSFGYSFINTGNHSFKALLKWKWTKIDLTFFDQLYLASIFFNPEINISEKSKVGIGSGLVYFYGKAKWNIGLTFSTVL